MKILYILSWPSVVHTDGLSQISNRACPIVRIQGAATQKEYTMELYTGVKVKDKLIRIELIYAFQFLLLDLQVSEPM